MHQNKVGDDGTFDQMVVTDCAMLCYAQPPWLCYAYYKSPYKFLCAYLISGYLLASPPASSIMAFMSWSLIISARLGRAESSQAALDPYKRRQRPILNNQSYRFSKTCMEHLPSTYSRDVPKLHHRDGKDYDERKSCFFLCIRLRNNTLMGIQKALW